MKRMITSAFVLAATLAANDALAQSTSEKRTWFQDRVAAPNEALELTVGSGYTQGFGMLRGDAPMMDVVTPGVGVDLGVAYRLSPQFSVGIAGQYQELKAEQAKAARGLTGGIAATYHFDPYTRLDPWIELGTGYRLLWEDGRLPANNTLSHGFQLARARVGLDVRVSPEVAIAPVVGADLNVFVWQDYNSSSSINDPRVSTFVFGGLQGRFDIGKTVGGAPAMAAIPGTTELTSGSYDELYPSPPPAAPPPQTVPVSPSISVSEELAKACNLHFSDIMTAPKFELDKDALLPADHEVLNKVADCVAVAGPLAGRGLKLVGHADPRGTQKYNMALGSRRATSVAKFLAGAGVDPARITKTSRGELDAIGTDEQTWQLDRRVDIHLAE